MIPPPELTGDNDFAGFQQDSSNRFEIRHLLGHGGMASVYEAYDTQLESIIALKILHPHLVTSSLLARLKREVVLNRRIQHPHIVILYDLLLVNGAAAISMELLKGGTLREMASVAERSKDRLPIFVDLVRQIVSGLDAAHNLGILHRDLKPQNVLLNDDQAVAKLADFGLACSFQEAIPAITMEGTLGGTPSYMAPEVFDGDWYDPRSDIYSLGVLAFEVLTGRLPFFGTTVMELWHRHRSDLPAKPSSLNPNVSPALDDIVLRCLEKNPDRRFQSTGELLAAFGQKSYWDDASTPARDSHNSLVTAQPASDVGIHRSKSGGRHCRSCGEPLLEFMPTCSWCGAEQMIVRKKGDQAVILLPDKDYSALELVLQQSDVVGTVDLYDLPTQKKIIEVLSDMTGKNDLDQAACLDIMNDLPCVLVEGLDSNDADRLQSVLGAQGARTTIRKASKGILARIQKHPFSSKVLRTIFSFGGITSFLGSMGLLSGMIILFVIPLSAPMSLLIIAGSSGVIATGAGVMIAPLLMRRGNRALRSLTSRSVLSTSVEESPLSSDVRSRVIEVLPTLKDRGLHRIIKGIVSLLETNAALLPRETAGSIDSLAELSLKLASEVQNARDKRMSLSSSQHIEPPGHHVSPGEGPESAPEEEQRQQILSETAHIEARAMTHLLQIRAQLESLVSSCQMAALHTDDHLAELKQALADFQSHIQAIDDLTDELP